MKNSNTRIFLIFTLCLFLPFISQAQEDMSTVFVGMSEEQRTEHIESFRENFDLINEMKNNNKDDRSIKLSLSKNAIEKDKIRNRSLSLNEKRYDRSISDYADGFSQAVVGNKYLVKLVYPNDANYPVMYPTIEGYADKFYENQTLDFFESKSKEILINFLGKEYQVLEAKLTVVMEHFLTIEVKIDSPDQFDNLLLEDSKLAGLTHIGNPPPSGRIRIVQ